MEETRADRRYVSFEIDGTLAFGTSGTQYTSRTARWRRSRGFGRPAISQRSQPAGPRHGKGLPQAPWLCKHGKRWRLRDHSGWYASGAAFASLQALSRGSSGVRRKNIPWAVQIDDSGTRLAPDDRLYEMTHVGPLHFIYAEDEHPGRVTWISTFSGTMGDWKEDFDGAAESERFLP